MSLNFLPPTSNLAYEINVTRIWKTDKHGKPYMGFKTSRRKADTLNNFQLQCLSYKNSNLAQLKTIREQLLEWISLGNVLRVDTWFAFEHGRIWTKDGNPQKLDADNRRKPLQDGLANILDIDDKWFFSGNVEKITCNSKDYEQCLIRITPHKARTLADIQQIKTSADSTRHF